MLNNFDAVLNTAGEKEPILLENLLFSLNMSLPLFIVMGLGCILTHKGFFTENYIAHTTNLVYYVLLPGKMFLDIATSDLSTAFDIRYVAVATGGVVLQFALAWAAGWLLCPDRSKQSAFSHAAYRGNFVYLGTALLQNIYGVSHVPSATLILALVIPLYNIQGVVLMTVKERQGRFRLSTVLLNVLKNPMILAVLAAIPFAYFKIQLPFVVSESLGYFQAATNTMALLVVGGSIRLSALKNDLPLLMRLRKPVRNDDAQKPQRTERQNEKNQIFHARSAHGGSAGHPDHRRRHAGRRQCLHHHRQDGRRRSPGLQRRSSDPLDVSVHHDSHHLCHAHSAAHIGRTP